MPVGEIWRPEVRLHLDRLNPIRDETRPTVGRAGATGKPVVIDPETLQRELRPALLTAAGFEPTDIAGESPPVLWDDGINRLVVHLADAEVRSAASVLDVSLTVECDQVGRDRVTCTFVTTPLDRPAGFIWATESRPRGAAAVVEVWGEALVSLCWRALIEIAASAAAAQGVDKLGRPLVPSTVVATPDGVLVVPIAAHRFMQIDRRLR